MENIPYSIPKRGHFLQLVFDWQGCSSTLFMENRVTFIVISIYITYYVYQNSIKYTIHFFTNQNDIRSTVSKYWCCLVFSVFVLCMCVCLLVYVSAVLRVRAGVFQMHFTINHLFLAVFWFNIAYWNMLIV